MPESDSTKRSFVRDASSVLGSRVFVMLLSFATSIVLARQLGPEGRGLLSVLMVVPSMIISLTDLGVRQSTVYLIGKREYPLDKIVSTNYSLLFVTCTLSILVTIGIYLYINNPNFTVTMLVLAVLIIPMSLITSYSSGILLGKQQIAKFNRVRWLPPLLRILLVVALVWLAGFGIGGALFAEVYTGIITAVYAVYLVGKHVKLSIGFDRDIAKKMVGLGLLYASSLFVMSLNYRVDIILLELLSTPSEIGHYTVGVSLAELIWQVPSALGVVIFARSANAKDQADFTIKVTKLLRVTMVFSGFVGAILCLFSGIVVPVIYGSEYQGSVSIILTIVPGVVLFTIFKVLNFDLAGRGKPSLSIFVFFPAVILNLFLNFLLIPNLGGQGAALASSVSYSFGALLFLAIFSKSSKIFVRDIVRFKKSDFDFLSQHLKIKL